MSMHCGAAIGISFALIVLLLLLVLLIWWFYPNGHSSTIDVNNKEDKILTEDDLKDLR